MDIREQLVQHYRWLRQYGLNDSHSGNASVREGSTVWVTPTGACADTLTPHDLVACHVDGSIGEGASLDASMHVLVYQKNSDARCVLHSHGPHSVALTLSGEEFSPTDFEGQYYFDRIPVLNIGYDEYVDESPRVLSDALAKHKIVIMRGHGVYTQAQSINLAYKWTCSLELSAQTAFIAQQAGTL